MNCWKTIPPSNIPEGKSKGHLSQTCTKLKVELTFYFFSYKRLDVCSFFWFFIHLSVRRIPLIKGKTARQALQEKGLWDEFRKMHPYNPLAKFIQSGTEPMTNDADVSPDQRQFSLGLSYWLSCVASGWRTYIELNVF